MPASRTQTPVNAEHLHADASDSHRANCHRRLHTNAHLPKCSAARCQRRHSVEDRSNVAARQLREVAADIAHRERTRHRAKSGFDWTRKLHIAARQPGRRAVCGCGGTGRRTGFRFQRRKAWRFKSSHPHQSSPTPAVPATERQRTECLNAGHRDPQRRPEAQTERDHSADRPDHPARRQARRDQGQGQPQGLPPGQGAGRRISRRSMAARPWPR